MVVGPFPPPATNFPQPAVWPTDDPLQLGTVEEGKVGGMGSCVDKEEPHKSAGQGAEHLGQDSGDSTIQTCCHTDRYIHTHINATNPEPVYLHSSSSTRFEASGQG